MLWHTILPCQPTNQQTSHYLIQQIQELLLLLLMLPSKPWLECVCVCTYAPTDAPTTEIERIGNKTEEIETFSVNERVGKSNSRVYLHNKFVRIQQQYHEFNWIYLSIRKLHTHTHPIPTRMGKVNVTTVGDNKRNGSGNLWHRMNRKICNTLYS